MGVISTAIGFGTIASGDYSTAAGGQTTAEDFMTFAIGIQNISGTPNPNQFSFQNTAFVIGNGGFDNNGQFLGDLILAPTLSRFYLMVPLQLQVT